MDDTPAVPEALVERAQQALWAEWMLADEIGGRMDVWIPEEVVPRAALNALNALVRELLAEIEGLTEFVHSIADGDAPPYETRTGSDGIHSYETCVYCGTDEGKRHNRWCLWVKANAALATLEEGRGE